MPRLQLHLIPNVFFRVYKSKFLFEPFFGCLDGNFFHRYFDAVNFEGGSVADHEKHGLFNYASAESGFGFSSC